MQAKRKPLGLRCARRRRETRDSGRQPKPPPSDTSQKALLVIRCIRPNERCVDKSQTREWQETPYARGPCAVPKGPTGARHDHDRPQSLRFRPPKWGLGYTQCIVTSRRPTWVKEVSPDTALNPDLPVASVQDEMEDFREQSRPESNICVAS